jgi:hypothetical protein
MTKLLIGLLGAGVIATGGYAAATSVDADPARTVSLPEATSTSGTTTADTAEDAASAAPAPAQATTTADDEDVSGPCDEAEHANDPRCTGGAPAEGDDDDRSGEDDDDDRSGHGAAGDDDDRSGSNSGKG